MHGTKPDSIDAAGVTPLIWREMDGTKFGQVLNHPDVFPLISVPGDEAFDATHIADDPRNVLLMSEGGGIFFHQMEPGIYECHTSFLPRFRGRFALKVSRACRKWMFTHTDCMSIVTKVPAFNRAAALAVRMVGFRREFVCKNAWPTAGGKVDL